ncbi:MAG: glycosyltransferase [Thermoplasmata archaeon]
MKRIAYYISDHGYGHAARSIAVIKRMIHDNSDIEVIVNCSYPLQFVIDTLVNEERVKFRRVRNDFGYYTDGNFEIDIDKTETRLKLCLGNIDSYIRSESKFSKKKDIDLIISDISAKPFEVAEKVEIPSIGISNFTWWEVYRDMIGDTKEVEKIKNMYQKADLGLKLPLDTDSSPFTEEKEVGLVAREPTRSYSEMREVLNHSEDKSLVYFSHGKSVNENNGFNIEIPDSLKSEMNLMSFSDNPIIKNPDYVIQEDENDVQDYIAASDLVISKFGYSTVAEAIRTKKPMILTKRDIIEDKAGLKKLKEWNIVREITRADFMEGNWLDDVGEVLKYQRNYEDIPDRFKRDGIKDVISNVEQFF